MKIVDVPQTGKLGLTVTYPSRNGLIRRMKVTPANPRSSAQMLVRSNLQTIAGGYKQLTDVQQNAWIAAAARLKSRPTLGQSGPLTAIQLYVKVNASLLAIGEAPVSSPPVVPTLPLVPVDALEATNTAGTIALKLHTTDTPAEGTMLWGCPPCSSGVRRPVSPVFLGTLSAPSNGYCDITTPYTTRFGVPAVGERVFVLLNANVNGYEGNRTPYSARIPASA